MGIASSVSLRLWLLGLLAAASAVGFMTLNVQSDWGFIISHRGPRLLAMLVAAVAVGVSTLVFQTITSSRILTPSLMGFDALFALTQAAGLLLWSRLDLNLAPGLAFGLDVALMVVLALVLFRLLFVGDSVRGLHLLVLLGLLGGWLFRELSSLALLVLDPTEFSIQPVRSLASFGRTHGQVLGLSLAVTVISVVYVFLLRRKLDVLGLGRELAINLGISYKKRITQLIVISSILVSISTALVGPMLFFGLLAANFAYFVCAGQQHRFTLPATIFAGVIFLVGGQVVTGQLLQSQLPFMMVLEILGGLLFVVLLLRGVRQ